MDEESLEQIERHVAGLQPHGPPRHLRAAVLADVQHELRAARWDRRLARAAAVLFIAGVGTNLAIGLSPERRTGRQAIAGPTQESLVQVAVTVAEATDAQTGRRFAQQWAALTGRPLTGNETAAIDAAIERRPVHVSNGGDG